MQAEVPLLFANLLKRLGFLRESLLLLLRRKVGISLGNDDHERARDENCSAEDLGGEQPFAAKDSDGEAIGDKWAYQRDGAAKRLCRAKLDLSI